VTSYREIANDLDLTVCDQEIGESQRVKLGFEQPQWYLEKRSFNIKIRSETVKEFVADSKHERILDIGCGDGSLSVPLLDAHNRLTLVDMSKAMLDIARSRVPPEFLSQLSVLNTPFMESRLAPGSFDLIISLGVLAYVEDTRAFVGRIASLLKPGGQVIFECTDSSHPVNVLVRAFGRARNLLSTPIVPLILHTSSEVQGVFKELGFEQCGAFRYSLPPPGLRRLLSQNSLYKFVRNLHGSAARNRFPWMGDECLFHFIRLNKSIG